MMSWAKVIDSLEDVPEIYKNPYHRLVGNTGILPYTVLVPQQGSSRVRKPRERLLCEMDGTFYILEPVGAQVTTIGFRYQEICSLEVGNILLYSWFTICGKTNTGTDTTLTVEFNEASLRHFVPFFSKMRPAPTGFDKSGLKMEQAKFDYLSTENYKFMSFARESLVNGEKVIQTIYQPLKRQSVFSVSIHTFYRTIFQAHLTILTDKEIILIGDAESIAENKRSKYGGVWRYITLGSRPSIELEEQPDGLLRLTFHISGDVQVERFFEGSNLQEIGNLKKALESMLL
jgi:hypothetical protein